MKLIICPYCKKPIEKRDQLVTVSNMFRIRPYHYVCYQKVELEVKAIWSLWTPLNGISGTVRFIILLGIAIWLLTTNKFGLGGQLLGLFSMYNVIVHITAYLLYDRRLPKL